MHERFKVVVFSHRLATIDIREKISLDEGGCKRMMASMKEVLGVDEAMVLSTCNRTEIYYTADESKDREIISLLALQKGIDTDLNAHALYLAGEEAVAHLYKVSMGLDAKVLGDIQISNQTKMAYQWCADEQMAGPFLHRLMHSVFYANKRVVQETAFRDGAASTSYACVDLAKQFIINFKQPKILVLGLGEIGREVAENLQQVDAEIFVTNRTISKAADIAKKFDYQLLDLDLALEKITDFDVIISSMVSDRIIGQDHFRDCEIAHKMLIDLSVPRSMDAELEHLPGILLYNIDQIESKTSEIVERREQAIPAVELIVTEAIHELKSWSSELEVSPTIKKLKQALEEIRKEELARYLKKASDKELDLLDKATKGIIQKVIKLPVLQLKAACKRGEADTLVEVLNDLFDLEKDKEKTNS
ncbi:MAG: glutamyl-tRNA reductase [Cyclobacteriaceae bacterium]